MIIHRYLIRDITKTWVTVLSLLLLIATSHKLVRLISKAASGDLSPALLLQMIGLQVPELLAFLMPLSFFIAILLAFGRYSVDNEFTAMMALGVSWKRLIGLGLSLSIVVMCLAGYMTLFLVPNLEHQKENMLASEEPILLLQSLNQGRFYSFKDDSLVFYVEELSDDKKKLTQVFIAEQPSDSPSADDDWTVISARSGQISHDKEDGRIYVELLNGHRYEGTPGLKDYLSVAFEKYGRLIERKIPEEGLYLYRSMPTSMLWGSSNLSFVSELQWRLSIPLSAPLLTLIAIPLSRVPPRKGRFHRILPALIIFIIYYNLLTMSKRWVQQGVLDPSIGVWWAHGAILLFGLILIGQVGGVWAKIAYRFKKATHG